FVALCDEAPDFLAGLMEAQPRCAAFHARRILELRERYAANDVAAAVAHALEFHAFSYSAVARIVEVRARPRTLEEDVAAETESKLRGLLGGERAGPRDLRVYDLPSIGDAATSPEQEPSCPAQPSTSMEPSKPE